MWPKVTNLWVAWESKGRIIRDLTGITMVGFCTTSKWKWISKKPFLDRSSNAAVSFIWLLYTTQSHLSRIGSYNETLYESAINS